MTKSLIEDFCDPINAALSQNENVAAVRFETLKKEYQDEDSLSLLANLKRNFDTAYYPTEFINQRVLTPGLQLDQCYALLSNVFGADVLDPKAAFERPMLAAQTSGELMKYTMVGRFWTVPGLQHYSSEGRLVQFAFDPLTATSSVAAVATGDYIPLKKHQGLGIGAVGQVASRTGMRGQGHGKLVVEAFEAEMLKMAAEHGQQLSMMILEAEPSARPFWASRGYRYPEGTRYMQPPIDYDRVTGKALFPAVPELLMVKPLLNDNHALIDRNLLVDAVHSIYNYWYMFDYIPEKARPEVETYVFGTLFQGFLDSLPPGDSPIPLVLPPQG